MNVSDLEGPLLDYWVAMAEGLERVQIIGGACMALGYDEYSPSTDWEQGGSIMEREQTTIRAELYGPAPVYFARSGLVRSKRRECGGETHLIAAMRAYVASKYGDTVQGQIK